MHILVKWNLQQNTLYSVKQENPSPAVSNELQLRRPGLHQISCQYRASIYLLRTEWVRATWASYTSCHILSYGHIYDMSLKCDPEKNILI